VDFLIINRGLILNAGSPTVDGASISAFTIPSVTALISEEMEVKEYSTAHGESWLPKSAK
jgi:hypothetical protein